MVDFKYYMFDWDDNILTFHSAAAMKWAQGKGKKLAPGLALTRNPTVTLSCLIIGVRLRTSGRALQVDWRRNEEHRRTDAPIRRLLRKPANGPQSMTVKAAAYGGVKHSRPT